MANHHIVEFIQHLSKQEINVIDDYIKKTKHLIEKEQEGVKELQLYNFIIANKEKYITEEEILKEITTPRLDTLQNNLFDKVLEALCFDKHISNKNVFNEYDIVVLKLKKQLLYFKIHFRSSNKGKTEVLNELLNSIIKKAIEYEAYDLLVEALTGKKYFYSIRSGIQEFDKINTEIDFYNYCLKAAYYANDSYYRLILNNEFVKSLSENDLKKHIQSSIKQMEIDYKKTKSEQINYYLQIMKFALSAKEKNYAQSIKYCNQLITILKKSKVIFRPERMGFAFGNLSLFKTHMGDYEDAAIYAQKAQGYYVKNNLNYIVSKEQEFYALFYDKAYSKAITCNEELLNHPDIDTGEFRKAKFIYYKACVQFCLKQYKETLSILNKSLEIEKDKSRWNISLRILTIMTFIELNKIDEASNSLESLRKHIERNGKNEEIKQRDLLIVQLLREMEKNGFELDRGNEKVNKFLKQLSEKKGVCAWEHYNTELIPFHEWLK